ncbi:methyltransferase family protein [Stackebrandtia albiflava]|uniref:Methyltransferase family protein n=1 Tax=Stackebrandtia albiflava TaxID=406432 RepID=A0A562VCX3_9ACTN|nr:class I SAM-dependent methyltransferase [Stackebrandtia albiflava]TWJ15705.1 methyltransferase family protein [Stackebrandtia albiflava]
MSRRFADLIEEAATVPVDGWDFGWLAGRATERRPSWGYARAMAARMALADTAADIDTGGGEVLAEAERLPRRVVATESWRPNLTLAQARLGPRGVHVVAAEADRLPLTSARFDLVVSRHPVQARWPEIARILTPGGRYFSQEVGPASVFELSEYFLGPQPEEVRNARHPDAAREAARAAGLRVVDLRSERLRMEFFDIGAVVYFLRKVVWIVPGFSVERFAPELEALHRQIEADGCFVAHSSRFLIEAVKP